MAKSTKPTGSQGPGYKNPPKNTQWKKGQSGNPSGKPKKAASIETKLKRLASKEIVVIENGTQVSMTQDEAMLVAVPSLRMIFLGSPTLVKARNSTMTKALGGLALASRLYLHTQNLHEFGRPLTLSRSMSWFCPLFWTTATILTGIHSSNFRLTTRRSQQNKPIEKWRVACESSLSRLCYF